MNRENALRRINDYLVPVGLHHHSFEVPLILLALPLDRDQINSTRKSMGHKLLIEGRRRQEIFAGGEA